MSDPSKAPPVYQPASRKMAAPPVYRPQQAGKPGVQLKPAANFRVETRPAPPVYRPQQSGVSLPPAGPKPQAANRPVQPQSQYELAPALWMGSGHQQIRVKAKGAPIPVGSVDVHYDQPGRAFISDLEVSQAHRRHGVATMLMKAAMESARRSGRTAIELEANPGPGSISKQALVSMYQKMGLRNAGTSRHGNPTMSTGSHLMPVQRFRDSSALIQLAKRKVKEIGTVAKAPKKSAKKEDDVPTKGVVVPLKYIAVDYGSRDSNQGAKIHILREDWEKQVSEGSKLHRMYSGFPEQVRKARSYAGERPKQILRWLATVIFQKFGGVEIQCYWDSVSGTILVSSNKDSVNDSIRDAVEKETLVTTINKASSGEHGRITRHRNKLFVRKVYAAQTTIKEAIDEHKIVVPDAKHKDYDLHAERRIQEKLGKDLDPACLGGVKRPCMVCAHALKFVGARRGPLWTTKAALGSLTIDEVLKHALDHDVITYVTFDKFKKKLSFNIDSDSESDVD